MDRGFDVVVVGGGTAGCVLAARLSEDPDRRVLLLEAGQAAGPPEMAVAAAWPALLGTSVDWCYSTTAQTGLGGAAMPYPRGKVLGGSSSINAMAHLRGHRDDYDGWDADGAKGWSFGDLLPYFRRSEDAGELSGVLRGSGGPMRVAPAAEPHPIARAGLAALNELGFPRSEDLNGAGQVGGGLLEMNAVDGRRQSARDGYLQSAMDRANLDVCSGVLADSLLVSDGRCSGVSYLQDGARHRVEADRVVLCAGAIGSPQILLRSGIGPADELRALGITVELDLPGVGRNLQDHPLAGVVYSARPGFPPGTNNHADAIALIRSDPALPRPDIQLLFMDVPFHPPSLPGPVSGYTIAFAGLRPLSRGRVSLASADPAAAPLIDPAYYRDEHDLDTMVTALRLARKLGNTGAFAPWRDTEVLPGPDFQDDEGLREHLRRGTGTYFHPVGTCRMGVGDDAVVDPDLRLNGIDDLFVVDASVMPSLVSANTNATVLAIAERAAEWLSAS